MESLREMRQQLYTTYARQNFWQFAAEPMALEILRRASSLLEERRKANWDSWRHILVDLFVWTSNFLSGLELSMEEELAKRYPGCCPYCCRTPCFCDPVNKGHRHTLSTPKVLLNFSVHGWQRLLYSIYPNRGITDQTATDKIAEEFGEMATAAKKRVFDATVEEAIDAIARIFAAANLPHPQGFSLEKALQAQYPDGLCCVCRGSPCRCTPKQILESYRPSKQQET